MPAVRNAIAEKFNALPEALKTRAYAWREKAVNQGGPRRRFTYQKVRDQKADPELAPLVSETVRAGVPFRTAEAFFLLEDHSGMTAYRVNEFAKAQRRSQAARKAAIASNAAQAAKRSRPAETVQASPEQARETALTAETDLIPTKWTI